MPYDVELPEARRARSKSMIMRCAGVGEVSHRAGCRPCRSYMKRETIVYTLARSSGIQASRNQRPCEAHDSLEVGVCKAQAVEGHQTRHEVARRQQLQLGRKRMHQGAGGPRADRP